MLVYTRESCHSSRTDQKPIKRHLPLITDLHKGCRRQLPTTSSSQVTKFSRFFFSCTGGLVLDMVGQLLEVKVCLKISLVTKKKTKQHPHNQKNKNTTTEANSCFFMTERCFFYRNRWPVLRHVVHCQIS